MSGMDESFNQAQLSRNKTAAGIEQICLGRDALLEAHTILMGVAEGTVSEDVRQSAAALLHLIEQCDAAAKTAAQMPAAINPYYARVHTATLETLEVPSAPVQPAPDPAPYRLPPEAIKRDAARERYRQQADSIYAQLDAGTHPEAIEGYVAMGGTCVIFQTADGNVLKLPCVLREDQTGKWVLPKAGTAREVYAEPLILGKEEGLEQFVDFIDDNGKPGHGAVICKYAPGKMLHEMTVEEKGAIPDKHYDALLKTLEYMQSKDLVIDNTPENIKYDPDKGFTILDYSTLKRWRKDVYANKDGSARDQGRVLAGPYGALATTPDVQTRRTQIPYHVVKFLQAYARKFGQEAAEHIKNGWSNVIG